MDWSVWTVWTVACQAPLSMGFSVGMGTCLHGCVQSLSRVQLFLTPWSAAHQASVSFTIPSNLLKLISIESVMPSDHFIFCCLNEWTCPWRIPWTEEPGRLQSVGSQRVGRDWSNLAYMDTRPLQVLDPVICCPVGHQVLWPRNAEGAVCCHRLLSHRNPLLLPSTSELFNKREYTYACFVEGWWWTADRPTKPVLQREGVWTKDISAFSLF